jgi:hypothetical protein
MHHILANQYQNFGVDGISHYQLGLEIIYTFPWVATGMENSNGIGI